MKRKAALLAAMALMVSTPFGLCSCGNHQSTTADSAGTPAGWHGHYIQMPDSKNGIKPNQVRFAKAPDSK